MHIERRRLQQRSDDVEGSSRELVQTAEDLAAKLRAFASDGIVVKHLIEFALPSKNRANALEVAAKGASAAAGSRSTGQGNATEHTKAIGGGTENTRSMGDDTSQPGNAPISTCEDKEHTEDNKGDDELAHDQSGAMSAAAEQASQQTEEATEKTR